MIIKQVAQVGNPIIRKVSKALPVSQIKSKKVKTIIKNLIDSMRYHGLVGMAAPQIGHNIRIFVTEIRRTKLRKNQSLKEADKLRIFINPKIISLSKQKVFGYEGCGSVTNSGLFGNVNRPKSIQVKAYNEYGELFTLEARGLLAKVIQHEHDHIVGKIFLDRMTNMKNLRSREEHIKQTRN
jgi:peptide deformylase